MRFLGLFPLLFLAGCSALGPAAVPVAIEVGRELSKAFASYVEEKTGVRLSQVNCEVEHHVRTREILLLCTGVYTPDDQAPVIVSYEMPLERLRRGGRGDL